MNIDELTDLGRPRENSVNASSPWKTNWPSMFTTNTKAQLRFCCELLLAPLDMLERQLYCPGMELEVPPTARMGWKTLIYRGVEGHKIVDVEYTIALSLDAEAARWDIHAESRHSSRPVPGCPGPGGEVGSTTDRWFMVPVEGETNFAAGR